MAFMKLIRSFWFISLILVASLSALIVWGSPYVAINNKVPFQSISTRLITILVLVFLWGLLNIIFMSRKSSVNKPVNNEPKNVEITKVDSGEVRREFEKILKLMSRYTSIGAFKKQDVPRYLILGEAKSGKTSLIDKSNIYSNIIGGLKDIQNKVFNNIWVGPKASFFELPDSYHEQTNNISEMLSLFAQKDNYAFNGFLITINVAHLLQHEHGLLKNELSKIQLILNTVSQVLEVNIPIYVIITHMDSIPGFVEFFGNLKEDVRSQAWGLNFANEQAASAEFDRKFDELLSKLNKFLLVRTQDIFDPDRNALIINFPYQMANLRANLRNVVSQIRNLDIYQSSYFVQGIYFTSTRQGAKPLDTLVNFISDKYKQNVVQDYSHGNFERIYFIKELIEKVIPSNANAATFAKTKVLSDDRLRKLTLLAASVITTGFVFVWFHSYNVHQVKFDEIASILASTREHDSLQQLNDKRLITNMFPQTAWSWLGSLGLYRGNELYKVSEQKYLNTLQSLFFPYLITISANKVQADMGNQTELYGDLKTYLMLGQPEHRNKVYIERWFTAYWSKQYSSVIQHQLNSHLHSLLSLTLPAVNLNNSLIASARSQLNTISPAQRAYSELKQLANQYGFLNLNNLIDSNFLMVFKISNNQLSIPWFYTAKGYQQFYKIQHELLLKKSLADNWVLGASVSANGSEQFMNDQLNTMYTQDYVQSWQNILSNIKIHSFNTLPQAVSNLAILSGANSPIRTILAFIADNAIIPNENKPMIGSPIKNANNQDILSINQSFSGMGNVLASTGDKGSQLDAILSSLSSLHDYMQTIATADNPNEAAFQAAKSLLSGGSTNSIFAALNAQAKQLPEPVRSWINEINKQSVSVLLLAAKQHINTSWENQIYNFYQQNLASRYPIIDSKQEITLADFTKFFAPQGMLTAFYSNYIQPFAQMDNGQLQVRSLLGQSMSFDQNGLQKLQSAIATTSVFFSANPQQPGLQFSLKPINLSANALQAQFNMGGQQFIYRHDPQRFQTFNWPALQPAQGIILSFVNLQNNQTTINIPGVWAWFRLIDQYSLKQQNPDASAINLNISGYQLSFQLQAQSDDNLLFINPMAGLMLPNYL